MCWITYDERHKDFKIAEEDIPVFKVVRKISLYSYYTDYPYTLNEVHTTEPIKIRLYAAGVWKIQKGFHSYSVECITGIARGACGRNIKVYDSDKTVLLDYYGMSSTCKLECIIPKGSLYYVNECGEYVSESILPLKIETW